MASIKEFQMLIWSSFLFLNLNSVWLCKYGEKMKKTYIVILDNGNPAIFVENSLCKKKVELLQIKKLKINVIKIFIIFTPSTHLS